MKQPLLKVLDAVLLFQIRAIKEMKPVKTLSSE